MSSGDAGSARPPIARDPSIESLFADLGVEVAAFRARSSAVHEPDLHPAEAAAVVRATPARRQEFATGRACARAALRTLGRADSIVPMRSDRSPSWPDGFVGSITHADGECLAVAGSAAGGWHPGIDVEAIGRLTPDVTRLVLTGAERSWLADITDESQADLLRTVVFAAKEALYKAQHPITGEWVGFDDVDARVEPGGGLALAPRHDDSPLERLALPVRATWTRSSGVDHVDLAVAAVVARRRSHRNDP